MTKIRFIDQTTLVETRVDVTLPYTVTNAVGNDGNDVVANTYREGLLNTVVAPPELQSIGTISVAAPAVGEIASMVGFAFTGAATIEWEWFRDGVQIATTETYQFASADQGKRITALQRGTNAGGSIESYASNEILIPEAPADTVLLAEEWNAIEAVADADTRKSYITSLETPGTGKRFSVSIRSTPTEDVSTATLVDMTDAGGFMELLTSTQATAGQTVYHQVCERNDTTDTGRKWVSEVKSFVASSVPGAPTFTAAQGAGIGEIIVTLTNGAPENGRPITRYEWSVDGNSWSTLANGTALGARSITGLASVTAYTVRIRGINVNGEGAQASQDTISGAIAVAPSAFVSGQVTVADSPSTLGDKLTLTINELPANGGSAITDVEWRSNGGSWTSIGTSLGARSITVTATTAATIEVRAENAIGFSAAYEVGTVTPSQIGALTTLAEFGPATPAGYGGWKPCQPNGDEVDITSIVSQAGMTRTWSIDADGSLIANGTPDVDHGKTITLSVLGANLVATINTTNCVANSWSVRTAGQLGNRLGTSPTLDRTVYVRPVSVDIRTGSTNNEGRFSRRDFSGCPSGYRKVTKHPNQIKRWEFTNTSDLTQTKGLWLDEFQSFRNTTLGDKVLKSGTGTNKIKLTNFLAYAPDIDPAALADNAEWPNGPAFGTHRGFFLTDGSDHHIENGTFRNVWGCGDYRTAGAFRLLNCTVENFYYDAFRLFPNSDNTLKIIKNIDVYGGFGINNELASGYEPHNDGIQFIGGPNVSFRNALIMNVRMVRGPHRGTALQTLQTNAGHNRVVVFNCAVMNVDSPWGYNPEAARFCVVANSTFAANNNGSSAIRLGVNTADVPGRSEGIHVVQNTYVRNLSGSSITGQVGPEVDDPGVIVQINNISGSASSNFANNFTGPDSKSTTTLDNLNARLSPIVGSTADTSGVGAFNTSGAWRTEIHPPLSWTAPTLTNSGADLIITPAAPSLEAEVSATFDYAYRNASGASWTVVQGLTAPSATLVAPNKTGIQVICRWVSSEGLKGTWSNIQTTIV